MMMPANLHTKMKRKILHKQTLHLQDCSMSVTLKFAIFINSFYIAQFSQNKIVMIQNTL